MASVNKVILIGNLGRDPEVRYSANGDAVCNLSLATAQQWKDKNTGERREETEWHRVVLYRRLAEVAGKYLRKGASVYIEGRLRTHKWQGKDGQDRYTTEIYAAELKMLGGRASGSDTSATHPTDNSYQSAKDGKAAPTQNNNNLADLEDDIPFDDRH